MTSEPTAVVGGGNGGHALAAWLAAQGLAVRWWLLPEDGLDVIAAAGAVAVEGALTGAFPFELATNDLEAAVREVPLIHVVIPAQHHAELAGRLAPLLTDGQTVLLHPGRTAGALCFRNALAALRPELRVTVGETQSLLLTCRRLAPGRVEILRIKQFGQCAFLGPEPSPAAGRQMAAAFPQMARVDSTLVTSLANIGAMLHPAPVLFNIGRIESSVAGFPHYYEGITPTIARFIERMDGERVELGRALGVVVPTVAQWHVDCYGVGGQDLYSTLRLNERYASLKAPADLNHRYLTEDLPTGLVPLAALARAARVEAPCMEQTLALMRLVVGDQLFARCRDAGRLGLRPGMSPAEIAGLFSN